MIFNILVLCFLSCSWAAPVPADEPIRVDLPVYNEPQTDKVGYDQPSLSSNVRLQTPLEPENYSGYSNKDYSPKKEGIFSGLSDNSIAGGIFSAPVTTREHVLLESEAPPSKILSIKDNLHSTVAGFFQPKPIVDTLKEEEKYGNNGDKFYSAGKAIVGGASRVSNFVNSLLEVPGNIFRQITKSASEKLNNLGGRLIGL